VTPKVATSTAVPGSDLSRESVSAPGVPASTSEAMRWCASGKLAISADAKKADNRMSTRTAAIPSTVTVS